MKTLVLSPKYSTDSDDMWRAAINTPGWDVHRALRYVPPDSEALACVFGEIGFCDAMADRMNLGLLEPPPHWLGTLPYELLKRDLWTGTVADLGRVTSRSFVKPANDKVFSYGVYERGSDVPTREVAETCPIIVSEVVAFDIEVRLHVLDNVVVTAGQYRLFQQGMDEDRAVAEAIEYITPILPSLKLPSSVVLDVGHIEERGWAIVEANQAYASGLYYQEDLRKALDVIFRASGPRSLVKPGDLPYLRNP